MIFILLLLLEISSAFEQRPQNTVVKIGQSFELSCSSASLPIDWYHTSFLTNSHTKIKKVNNLTFNTYGDIPGQRLNVSSAKNEHAGTYTCSAMGNNTTSEASAIVVVIVDDPICEMKSKASLMENDRVELRCSFSSLGSVRPLMRWRQLTDVGWNSWKEFNCTQSMNQIFCQLNCLADLKMHQSRFQSQASFHDFSSTKSHAERADNAFNYLYLWTSDVIRILYGPRNLVIHPPDGILYPNEQVNCSAEGFPPPSIEWINLRTNETIPGPRLPLDKTLGGDGARLFMCRAVNVETKQTANITVEFRVPDLTITTHGQTDRGTLNLLTKLLLSAFAVSLVVIGVLVIYIISRKRKSRTTERSKEAAMPKSTLTDIRCRQKVPLHRVSRRNFPEGDAKLERPHGNIDHLSAPSDPTQTDEGDYDEIPDGQTLSVQNIVYFDQPSTKSLVLPSSSSSSSSSPPSPALSRARNAYMRASDNDLSSKDQLYESLRVN